MDFVLQPRGAVWSEPTMFAIVLYCIVLYCIDSVIFGTPRFWPRSTGILSPLPSDRTDATHLTVITLTLFNPVNEDFPCPFALTLPRHCCTILPKSPLFPAAAVTRAAGGGGKPGHISAFPGYAVKGQSFNRLSYSVGIFWTHYSMVKPLCSNFRVSTSIFSGVQFLRNFYVICSSIGATLPANKRCVFLELTLAPPPFTLFTQWCCTVEFPSLS